MSNKSLYAVLPVSDLKERNMGVTEAIEWMGSLVVGLDALPFAKIVAQLRAHTRHVAGGIASQGRVVRGHPFTHCDLMTKSQKVNCKFLLVMSKNISFQKTFKRL